MDTFKHLLSERQIKRIRDLIHRYPNTGPYAADFFWRHILWPVSYVLYLEQQRRERGRQVVEYENYHKRRRQMQMLFIGPDGIPRSRKTK